MPCASCSIPIQQHTCTRRLDTLGSLQVPSTPIPPYSLPTLFSKPQTTYQHIYNICAATHALVSAKTTLKQRNLPAQKHSKEQWVGDQKATWSLSLPSYKSHSFIFICVSSIHPTLEPSLTCTPSLRIPLPPPAILSPQTQLPDRSEKSGFLFQFSSIFIGCNDLSLDRKNIINKNS